MLPSSVSNIIVQATCQVATDENKQLNSLSGQRGCHEATSDFPTGSGIVPVIPQDFSVGDFKGELKRRRKPVPEILVTPVAPERMARETTGTSKKKKKVLPAAETPGGEITFIEGEGDFYVTRTDEKICSIVKKFQEVDLPGFYQGRMTVDELINFQDGDFGVINTKTTFHAKTYLRLFKAEDGPSAEQIDRRAAQERRECGICKGGEDNTRNPIASCDGRGCQVFIHVLCRSTVEGSERGCGKKRWYCDPCADSVPIVNGVRGESCARCSDKSLSEPLVKVNSSWQHHRCFSSRKKIKKASAKSEQSGKRSQAAAGVDQAISDTISEDQWRRRRDKECWSVMYRALEAECLVCEDYKVITNQPGRFQKAHIDATQKTVHDAGSDSWNTVPSCECNQMYGSMNMFDFMAGKTITRGHIKEIACKKLYAHLRNGFGSTGPTIDDYVKFFKHGHFEFASMVETIYNCQKMHDANIGYAALLTLSPNQDLIFKSLLNNDPAPYKHSDWEPSSI